MIPHEEYWRQFLDPDMVKHCSITDFKGMTIGINSTNWLVKALLASMEGLIDNHFKDYMFYVDQILSKVRNFRIAGVEPVMVFEGRQNLLKVKPSQHLSSLSICRLKHKLKEKNLDNCCWIKAIVY